MQSSDGYNYKLRTTSLYPHSRSQACCDIELQNMEYAWYNNTFTCQWANVRKSSTDWSENDYKRTTAICIYNFVISTNLTILSPR